MPEPENRLWYYLRSRRLKGVKFRRQYGLGSYIIDFYCPTAKLAIEIDGDSHYSDKAGSKDKQREEYLKTQGIKTIRFTNTDVMRNIEGVLEKIVETVKQ